MSENRLVSDKQEPASSQNNLIIQDRKLIKEGTLVFRCTDTKETQNQINTFLKETGSYIANENQYNSSNSIDVNLVIRVPADNFDLLVNRISEIADRMDSKSIQVKDVTEEYMDVETRIKIKKEVEQKYRSLLARARSIKDILAIEANIGNIRSEIETNEGRLKFLKNKISLGTLNVRFYKKTSVPYGFFNDFTNGLSNGWDHFLMFIIGLVNIWPFLILIVIFIVGFYKIRKKRNNAVSR